VVAASVASVACVYRRHTLLHDRQTLVLLDIQADDKSSETGTNFGTLSFNNLEFCLEHCAQLDLASTQSDSFGHGSAVAHTI
jgi:hypothetical protein